MYKHCGMVIEYFLYLKIVKQTSKVEISSILTNINEDLFPKQGKACGCLSIALKVKSEVEFIKQPVVLSRKVNFVGT